MGAGQSRSAASGPAAAGMSKTDMKKAELFSLIFEKLIKTTDIFDIKALTKGPDGACGDYVMLLAKNIDKEFKKIKLQTSASNSATISDFLYVKRKTGKTETPTQRDACRALSVFYIRALQLVAAMTMSIYTPPELVTRIRNKTYDKTLKSQKREKRILTPEEKEEARKIRTAWFMKFFSVRIQDGTFGMPGNPELKYVRSSGILIFTEPESLEQYRGKVDLFNADEFELDDTSKITSESYWIVISNPKTGKPIYRALVDAKQHGYIFDAEAPKDKGPEPMTDRYFDDWTFGLPEVMTTSGLHVPQASKPENSTGYERRGLTRRPSWGPWAGGDGNNRYKSNGTRKNNVKKEVKQNTFSRLNLSETTTLPRFFQESYRSMLKWTIDIPEWTEAAPASYRSVLVYIRPPIPNASATSYLCVDNWAGRSMRNIAPFGALESLYFNKDDGTASPQNEAKLKKLTNDFIEIYTKVSPALRGTAPVTSEPSTFNDVYVPQISDAIRSFCLRKTTQGDVAIEAGQAKILEKAQKEILALYEKHFETCYEILKHMFTVENQPNGEVKISFSDSLMNSTKGARNVLEENFIGFAAEAIATHYLDVERIYYKAIQDLIIARAQ
jgi:hypothetical protein